MASANSSVGGRNTRNSTSSTAGLMSGNPATAILRGSQSPSAENIQLGSIFKDNENDAVDFHLVFLHEYLRLSGEGTPEETPTTEDNSLDQLFKYAGKPVGKIDELTLLLSDAPFKKLKRNEILAQKQLIEGDHWAALRTCQEILALAEMFGPSAPYEFEKESTPLLVPDAHVTLAKAYAGLACIDQATEHCNRAIQEMPQGSPDHNAAFKHDTYILLAEMMMKLSPPKPQEALKLICVAAEVSHPDEIQSPGHKLLVAQCHAQMGMAKLHEADATRRSHIALEQRCSKIKEKLESVRKDSKGNESKHLVQTLSDTQNELKEDREREVVLIKEAHAKLTEATDILMVVIDEEETRLRQMPGLDFKRLICELAFKLSSVDARLGDTKEQLRALVEIRSAHEVYDCVPLDILSDTLQMQGEILLRRAGTVDHHHRNADLTSALEIFEKLFELQSQRFEDDDVKQAVAQAEVLKLIGDVKIAMEDWESAHILFLEAKKTFDKYLGKDNPLAIELKQRVETQP